MCNAIAILRRARKGSHSLLASVRGDASFLALAFLIVYSNGTFPQRVEHASIEVTSSSRPKIPSVVLDLEQSIGPQGIFAGRIQPRKPLYLLLV